MEMERSGGNLQLTRSDGKRTWREWEESIIIGIQVRASANVKPEQAVRMEARSSDVDVGQGGDCRKLERKDGRGGDGRGGAGDG